MRRCTLTRVLMAAGLGLAFWGSVAVAQEAARTSENTPMLKKMLHERPEADANKDGILTMEEARAAREQAESQRTRPAPRGDAAPKSAPTKANVAYGDHERNVLDFWQAESSSPAPLFVWIHGGGFRGGDKSSIPADMLKLCLESGISCAAINYRLTDAAPHPAQMRDSARAIQFLRSKSAEWNLDPKRFAAGGSSAGSGISEWLGFHDDLAEPNSDDPVARQSTRLSCVFPINMQSTYDPRDIKRIVPGDAYKHPALLPLFGRPEGWDWDTGEIDAALDAMLKDASPINHLSKDDPPVYILASAGAETVGNIHHPNLARHLKEAMDKLGIECVLRMDRDFDSTAAAHADMVEFLKKHFKM